MTQNARQTSIIETTTRSPRAFDRPTDGDGRPLPVSAWYGTHTFGLDQMRERLTPRVYEQLKSTVDRNEPLDASMAEAVAQAVKAWAVENACTHFCHWFQPMTGLTAEKHDAFLTISKGSAIERFSGSQLIQSEPDASSFPSGGMRTTFEARGYTAWDPTSPMFIHTSENGHTLCIPSVFISYHGDALDRKTPLLRSMKAVNHTAVKLLKMLSDDAGDSITVTAGPEQEYFLIDKALYALRPDLQLAGRTLIGAPSPRGQSLDDHYFGAVPMRVQAFMQEVEAELYRMGVPAKTRHNEVAPTQFELAVIFDEANVAADHNQIVMDTLKRVAIRHNFRALLHEKPYAGVNGSGKHVNWSLSDDKGDNLLEPGTTPHQNVRFLAVLASVLLGVHRNAAVLRSSIASHGNDFRLGANEAPPAIISVFLGDTLSHIVNKIVANEAIELNPEAALIEIGVANLPDIEKDNTDRNRTSPFAFTGNKFEFRAVGSTHSISVPLVALNAAVADGLDQLSTWIEEAGGGQSATMAAIRKALIESSPVRFEGDGYSDAWVEDAENRGLPHLRHTASALNVLDTAPAKQLFVKHAILSEAELNSRYHVRLEQYLTQVEIEADTILEMVNQGVLPAAIADLEETGGALVNAKKLDVELKPVQRRYKSLANGVKALESAVGDLSTARANAEDLGEQAKAERYATEIMPAIENVRAACDHLETIVSDHRWPYPRYREILFMSCGG